MCHAESDQQMKQVYSRTALCRKHVAQLQIELAQRSREALALGDKLETFAYSVSHDLQTPLRRAEGCMDLLAGHLGASLNGDAAHCFIRVKAAIQQMGAIVSPLLHFSSLGEASPARHPLDLRQLVGELVEACKGDLHGRPATWIIQPLPVIQGDAEQIRVVFQQLLDNAVKFTRRRPQAWIEVGFAPGAEGEAVIFVRDNGVGFDPAHAHKLFWMFHKVHGQNEFEGAGTGLAQVQKIVQRHGGRVWAEGSPDRGATFYVAFPHKI